MASDQLATGRTVGRYRLEEVLGQGAMGTVYRAVTEGGETVALKVLKEALAADEVYRRRFAHEARAAGEIRHDHLVPILDAGEEAGYAYMAVSYVPGTALSKKLEADGRLPLDDAVRIAGDIGSGLDALHRAGLVHRDVKPANVLVAEDGSALLTDFGLAKGPAYTVLTKPGEITGTLDYLAPELIRGDSASSASDVYSLGCLVYECVVGQAPFAERGLFEVAAAHLEEVPPDPRARRGDVNAEFAWVLLKALEKEPGERPSTAATYARMLRLALRPPSS